MVRAAGEIGLGGNTMRILDFWGGLSMWNKLGLAFVGAVLVVVIIHALT